MDYKIIDNFLLEEDHIKIKDVLLGNQTIQWYLNNNVSSPGSDDGCYFNHTFFDEYETRSDQSYFFAPFLQIINPKALIRFRACLYPKTDTLHKHGWHTDKEFEHQGCIYYINTNNGKTILKYEDSDDVEVDSIANRALFFNPNKLHRSTSCTDENYRCIIVVNYFA